MFILAPAPASLPDCEITPHLLPFALSPTPVTAPVSAYFVPRPAPAAHAFAGSLLAAFRGRQVVGQALDVPRGYRGVVLRAGELGVVAMPSGPSTAAASASATSASATASTSTASATVSDNGPATRTRQRGAAQVALARPRAVRGRRARVVIQEDDDDDDDEKEDEGGKDRQGRQDGEDGDGEPPAKRRAVMAKPHARVVVRTPAAPVINVPVINIVPSSPVEVNGDEPDDEGEHMARQVDLSCPHAQVDAGPGLMEVAGPEAEAVKDPGRVLVPVARFVRFVLWTPDGPLAGFRAGEGEGEGGEQGKEGEDEQGKNGKEAEEGEGKNGKEAEEGEGNNGKEAEEGDGKKSKEAEEAEGKKSKGKGEEKEEKREAKEGDKGDNATLATQQGWWRRGGAGEGGDEVVRALGEWLGLNEIIHAPTYPSEDEDEDEGE